MTDHPDETPALAASEPDNASRPWDASDDAGHEHLVLPVGTHVKILDHAAPFAAGRTGYVTECHDTTFRSPYEDDVVVDLEPRGPGDVASLDWHFAPNQIGVIARVPDLTRDQFSNDHSYWLATGDPDYAPAEHAVVGDAVRALMELHAVVGPERLPAALHLAIELAKNGVTVDELPGVLRAHRLPGALDVTLEDVVATAEARARPGLHAITLVHQVNALRSATPNPLRGYSDTEVIEKLTLQSTKAIVQELHRRGYEIVKRLRPEEVL